MGATFAHAALRAGHTVVPINRSTDVAEVYARVPEPESVVVAVGESDLTAALAKLPDAYRDRTLLLQNELLPGTWRRAKLVDPTVAVVWFEKKRNTGIKPILPTPIGGPGAERWARWLGGIGVPVEMITAEQLPFELVAKNVYILTANLAGLEAGGTVGELVAKHSDLVGDVMREVLAVQAAQLAADGDDPEVDLGSFRAHFERAVAGDPEHAAKGRSAPARRQRLLDQAERLGVPTPTISALG